MIKIIAKWLLPMGIALLLSEALCNNLVKVFNGGSTPMAISSNMVITTVSHIPMTASTHLNFLADTIRVGNWFFSVGDLLGLIGLILSYVGIIYWTTYVCRILVAGKVVREINGGTV